jgi:hypothetical protein
LPTETELCVQLRYGGFFQSETFKLSSHYFVMESLLITRDNTIDVVNMEQAKIKMESFSGTPNNRGPGAP